MFHSLHHITAFCSCYFVKFSLKYFVSLKKKENVQRESRNEFFHGFEPKSFVYTYWVDMDHSLHTLGPQFWTVP